MEGLYKRPRRVALILGSGLTLAAAVVLAVVALSGIYRAEAHQDPPDCIDIGLGGSVSNPLGVVAHGDVVEYSVEVTNPLGNCNVDDLHVELVLPDGSSVPVLAGAILDNGDSITCPDDPECLGPATYSYTVDHADENGGSAGCPPILAPGNTQITAYAQGGGTGHGIIHDDATVCQAKSNPVEHDTDLKKIDFWATGPSEIDVSQDATVVVEAILHNNGPVCPVAATDTITAVAPPDCTVTPESVSEQVLLDLSVSETVSAEFTIHCTEPSTHTIKFCDEVTHKDPTLEDPDPGNNQRCTTYTVDILGEADLKIVDFFCAAPPVIPVSEDVVVECAKVLHNNGPLGPVAAEVTKAASCSPSPDCSITPGSASEVVELPVSQSVAVVEEFTLHCSSPGSYEFVLTNEVDAADEMTHVVIDPDSAETRFTVDCPGAEGCTPGYWKNNLVAWGPTGFSTDDSFELVFGTAPEPFPTKKVRIDDPTLLEVLNARGGGINALSRHAVAALLNSSHPDVGYGMSPAAVIAAYQAALLSGDDDAIEAQKDDFAELNEAGCPIDAHGRVIEDD